MQRRKIHQGVERSKTTTDSGTLTSRGAHNPTVERGEEENLEIIKWIELGVQMIFIRED